jgi:hypothetical protein
MVNPSLSFCFFDLDAAMDDEDMGLDLDGDVIHPYHHDSPHKVHPSLSAVSFFKIYSCSALGFCSARETKLARVV